MSAAFVVVVLDADLKARLKFDLAMLYNASRPPGLILRSKLVKSRLLVEDGTIN